MKKKTILIISTLGILFILVLFVFMGIEKSTPKNELEKENVDRGFTLYVIEKFNDGLKNVEMIRRNNEITYRTVITEKGKDRVSVADGYRILYAYPNTKPIAKLHIEKSKEGEYKNDKRKLVSHLQHLSRGQKGIKRDNYRGIEYYSLDSDSFTKPITGLTLMFFPKDQIIGTVYFLFQESKNSRFQSYQGYMRLRNKFVIQYLDKVMSQQE